MATFFAFLLFSGIVASQTDCNGYKAALKTYDANKGIDMINKDYRLVFTDVFNSFTEQFECTASEERASNDAVLNAEWNFGLNNVATLRIVQEDLKTRLQHIHNAIKVALPAWSGKLGNFFRWKI
ncbi:unnamed protein product [Enterobius vermicularis]|uniref:Uncharacterized protein n=1 Tax=Enterobius vermicularis TaxID=51028 RepID=A0A0N4VFB1_ENTVE|nr:unnamed protein product [Enterobius vermicularis]